MQKSKKSTTPKFKVGDFIANKLVFMEWVKIIAVDSSNYTLTNKKNNTWVVSIKDCDRYCKKATPLEEAML